MRCIAKYRRYKLGAREHIAEPTLRGMKVHQYGVVCEFQHGGVRDYEKDAARKVFKIKGITTEQDQVTPIDPFSGPGSRLSVFDTDNPELNKRWAQWDKLEGNHEGTIKSEVEEFLRSYGACGIDYIAVDPVHPKAPWPKYDAILARGKRTSVMAAQIIVDTAEQIGVDPAVVIAYERENLNRPDVIKALEFVPQPEPEEIVAA